MVSVTYVIIWSPQSKLGESCTWSPLSLARLNANKKFSAWKYSITCVMRISISITCVMVSSGAWWTYLPESLNFLQNNLLENLPGELQRDSFRTVTLAQSRAWWSITCVMSLSSSSLVFLGFPYRWAFSKKSSTWCIWEFFLFLFSYAHVRDDSIMYVMSIKSRSFEICYFHFVQDHVRDPSRDRYLVRDQLSSCTRFTGHFQNDRVKLVLHTCKLD